MRFTKLVSGLTLIALGAPALRAQDAATIDGVVTGPDKAPIQRAKVNILGTPIATETDAVGAFQFTGIKPGRYNVQFRMLGYIAQVQAIDVIAGSTLSIPISLVAAPSVLEEVNVVAASPHLQGFEERRQRGAGRFFDRNDIEKMQPRGVTDILRRVPGFQFQPARMDGQSVQTGRTGTRVCPVLWYINGSPFPVGADNTINSFVDPEAVDGIEVYSGASSIPPQFNSSGYSSRCGVVVIWTRIGMDKTSRR